MPGKKLRGGYGGELFSDFVVNVKDIGIAEDRTALI